MANATSRGKLPKATTASRPPSADQLGKGAATGKPVRLNIIISPELHKRFKRLCLDNEVSMTDYLLEYIRQSCQKA
jgi:ParG